MQINLTLKVCIIKFLRVNFVSDRSYEFFEGRIAHHLRRVSGRKYGNMTNKQSGSRKEEKCYETNLGREDFSVFFFFFWTPKKKKTSPFSCIKDFFPVYWYSIRLVHKIHITEGDIIHFYRSINQSLSELLSFWVFFNNLKMIAFLNETTSTPTLSLLRNTRGQSLIEKRKVESVTVYE